MTPSLNVIELTAQFDDSGDSFGMHLEDNSTVTVIAGTVGHTDWRLPVCRCDAMCIIFSAGTRFLTIVKP